jgi:hypothetical protein
MKKTSKLSWLYTPVLISVMFLFLIGSASAAIIDTVNADKNPATGTVWGARDVGWKYTPSFSYTITGVETKFGYADGRTVTLEIYSDVPNNGGSLLQTANFTPVSGVFTGVSFTGLLLTGGSSYFIGFRNVYDLGVNVTNDLGAVSLGQIYLSWLNSSGSYDVSFSGGFSTQPIIKFDGSAVPLPPSLLLLAPGLIGLAGLRKKFSK